MAEGAVDVRVWKSAGLLALLHAILALTYAYVTPFCTPGVTNGKLLPDIGAPDERAHAWFVKQIADGGGLPVLRPGSPDLGVSYESHQPPVYYLLAAGWSKALGVKDAMDPASGVQVRSLNAVLGAGAVLGVFFLAIWTTRRGDVALGACALSALLPMMCALSGAVSNDPLAICLCTWSLALMARWGGKWSLVHAAALGLLIGVSILTKTTALLLIPTAIVAMLASDWRRNLSCAIVCSVFALFAAMPWLMRNQQLYGDPLAVSTFNASYPKQVEVSQLLSGLRPMAHWVYVLGAGTALSFVGEFGYMDIHLPYAIYVPLIFLIVFGILVFVRFRKVVPAMRTNLAISMFFWLTMLAYVAFNLRYVQPQARYLFPAIGPIALWISLGYFKLHRNGTWAICLLLAIANVYALAKLPSEFRTRVEAAKSLPADPNGMGGAGFYPRSD